MNRRWPLLLVRLTLAALLFAGVVLSVVFGTLSQIMTGSPFIVFCAIGLLVTGRQPRNPIGWLFLCVGTVAGVNGALAAIIEAAAGTSRAGDWYVLLAAWVYNFLWLILLSASTIFTLLLFPDGLASRRWRPVLWAAAAATTAGVVIAAMAPDFEVGDDTYQNPLHVDAWARTLSALFSGAVIVLLICGVLAVIQVVVRYRASHGVERLQLQWFAFAAVVFAVLLLMSIAAGDHPLLSDLLFTVGFSLIPISCGVAILRYRLYDLGRIVSRTTSYAIVTATVVLTYAIVVTSVTKALPASEDNQIAVAGATLAAAALARPLLRRVQTVVDRRFDRTRYDAQHTVGRFGEVLRHEIDENALEDHLMRAVEHTLQPSHVRLWLSPETP